jgi:alpha-glucosidase
VGTGEGLLHGLRLIGGRNAVRAVRMAVRRRRADRGLAPLTERPRRQPAAMGSARLVDGSVRVECAAGLLELRFPGPGRVSVGWDAALDEPSHAVVEATELTTPTVERTGAALLVHGPSVSVVVHPDGALEHRDGAGRIRWRDAAPVWAGGGWSVRAQLPDGASVHGLGGRTRWDLRGGEYRCWNTDPGGAWRVGQDPLSVTTPALAAIDDVGAVHCFVDTTFDGTVTVADDAVTVAFVGGPARWHLALGTLPEVLDAHTRLTGRPAVPPRWALGHHQARWGYGSAEVVRGVWQGFRDHDLPLSALHLDIDHMDRLRNFTFGPDWRGIGSLVREMADDGVRTVVIVDAGLARCEDYPQYREALARDLLCRDADGGVLEGVVWPGPTVFPDFTDPEARAWWGAQLRPYVELGVAGYWHDMNEPSVFVAFGDPTFPLSTRHRLDGRGGDHREAHNVYGLLMCRASYEGLLALQPQQRPFLFSRSGWAGMQRYGGHWSGDIAAHWSALPATVHQALGFGIGGVGLYGSDIGGFTGVPSPELFTRWFQLGSFLPFFRTHCAFDVPRREPWEWGEEVMGRLRVALRRRYRLLPYWYSLALGAARDGAPPVRPLAWLDPALRGIDDAFLVGEAVLVAPVLDEGATVRRVVLPDGTWYHGDTGQRLADGVVELPVGPDDLPWFLRAGAVVPTEEVADGVRRLVLLVAPPDGPGTAAPGGVLRTDAGDGWDPPHEEHYAVRAIDGVTVVHRTVVAEGAFGFDEVVVRAVDASPARLA